jgi:hypothetical protein
MELSIYNQLRRLPLEQQMKEILDYDLMKQKEFRQRLFCFNLPTNISLYKRNKTVNWICHLNDKADLGLSNLSLAVHLFDRFLTTQPEFAVESLPLLGITCLFIASKYIHGFSFPSISALLQFEDLEVDHSIIYQMELLILLQIDFDCSAVSPVDFLFYYALLGEVSPEVLVYGCFLLELSLISTTLCRTSPSLLAATALYSSFEVTGNTWDEKMCRITGYQASNNLGVYLELQRLLTVSFDNKRVAAVRKYSTWKHLEVATIRFRPVVAPS